jgi:hypothetical protein
MSFGMIGLAGFDRSLTRYRNNSADIAGTARSRLISGVEMQCIFILRSRRMQHRGSALISLYLSWHKFPRKPDKGAFFATDFFGNSW